MFENMGERNLTIQLVVNGGKVVIGFHSADQVVILALDFHNSTRLCGGWLIGFF